MQISEFLEQCRRLVLDAKSSEGQQSMRGMAYLVAAVKLYNGPNSLTSNPTRGGLRSTAEKLGIHVRLLMESSLCHIIYFTVRQCLRT